MNKNTDTDKTENFPATVAHVLNTSVLVINRGQLHGVKLGQRFVIYVPSEQQIIDPETGNILGTLEVPKAMGRVVHVQDHMATIESVKSSDTSVVTASLTPIRMSELGFLDVNVGDKAKPV